LHQLNATANTVHQELAIKCGLPKGPQTLHCKYEPQSVLESSMYKLYCDMAIKGKGKGKGKAVPLQTWSGPEGSRKLR
jgi:hypothetical protein